MGREKDEISSQFPTWQSKCYTPPGCNIYAIDVSALKIKTKTSHAQELC